MNKFRTLLKKRHKTGVCVIGVMGLSRGVGTTHAALLFAGFIRSFYGKKTVLLEVSGNEDLCYLFESEKKKQEITKYGVHYITGAAREDITQIRNAGYEYCIIDFGCRYSVVREEMLSCDLKIIIGGGAPWQKKMWNLAGEINKEVKDCSSFCFLVNFGDISDEMKRNLSPAAIYSMSYEPDLFRISETTVRLFHKIFDSIS